MTIISESGKAAPLSSMLATNGRRCREPSCLRHVWVYYKTIETEPSIQRWDV